METKNLIPRLVKEFGYTAEDAEIIANKLELSTYEVQTIFDRWWKGMGLDLNFEVQGYTLKNLIDNYGMNPIAALLTMDWLIREPDEAVEALIQGYDLTSTSSTEEMSQQTSNKSMDLKRNALIVGINNYRSMNLPSLRYAEGDAYAFASVLQKYGKFEVKLITGQEATRQMISMALAELISNKTKDDTILFYYAGHAVQTIQSDISLVAYDSDDLTGISTAMLRRALYERTRAGQVLIILDCYYSGTVEDTNKPEKRLAKYFEISKTEIEHSTFSHGLRAALIDATIQGTPRGKGERMSNLILQALQGKTDTAPDSKELPKFISLQDVYSYITSKTPTDVKPRLLGNVDEQPLILATSP